MSLAAESTSAVGKTDIAKEDKEDASLVRTFHIGNSLTDTVNGWLAPVAESAGRKLDFHRFTIPGAPTEWLWNHPGSGFGDSNYTEAFVALTPIDHLFTQPFAGHSRSIENEAEHTGKFYALCRRSSMNVHLWLYQQWPGKKFNDKWSKGIYSLGSNIVYWKIKIKLKKGESFVDGGLAGWQLKKTESPKTWQEAAANHTRYFEILRTYMQRRFPGRLVLIVPGGRALIALKDQIEAGKVPAMKDFFAEIFADDLHLSAKGRYLISLVHYACIYAESPEGKVSSLTTGLSAEQARIFQRIAWQTVRDYEWSGISKRGNKSLAIMELGRKTGPELVYLPNDYGFLIVWLDNKKPELYLYDKPANKIEMTQDFSRFLDGLQQFPDGVKLDRIRGCAITAAGISREDKARLDNIIKKKGFRLTNKDDGNFTVCTCQASYVRKFTTTNPRLQ
ncbi:MAG: hypothetical protein ACYS67_16845 [Planctomycetota bacterium]